METQVINKSKNKAVNKRKYTNGESKKRFTNADFVFKVPNDPTILEGIRKDVFLDRYSLKDEEGKPLEEYPEQMWKRVAWGIAQQEKPQVRKEWESKFYSAMEGFKFVPAGRILSGAGTPYQVTYYNCYVIPSPKDSRAGIMENITMTVEIQARGGGVGVNLSSLRPRGARVKKVNGTSSGPVNWAALYSTANHDVIQQGGSRRGALMLMLNDWHPDLEEFITVKKDLTKIPGANLSVCVSDAFMEAVKNDSDWNLVFPDNSHYKYDEEWDGDLEKWKSKGYPVIVHKTVKAKAVWEMVAEAAWRSAEPGVVFIDRYNKLSNTWYFEKIIATNPCGEQGLGAWGVCNLGHLNLSAFVNEGVMDYKSLGEHARTAVRFLDNVVDANHYFYEQNKKAQFNIRRTGLGTLGLADSLIKMGIKYGSEESIPVIRKIYETIRDNAYETSALIAKEKGPFGGFDGKKYLKGVFIRKLPLKIRKLIAKDGIRNAIILTQAPTGTISLLSGVSSGIEPVYEFTYRRNDRTGEHIVNHPLYQAWLDTHPNEKAPDYFVSASQLTPEDHVRVQATVQNLTDSSISKTVNAPNSHTVDDVKKLYRLAYELGCKGITYFRDGSRTGVLSKVDEKKNGEAEVTLERPMRVNGATYRIPTPLGVAFITVNQDAAGNPFEVFITIGKAGSEVAAMAEALGRMISTTLRFGNHLPAMERAREIVEQLRNIGGGRSVGFGPNKVRSLPDAVAKALSLHFGFNGENHNHEAGASVVAIGGAPQNAQPQLDPVVAPAEILNQAGDICPSCGASSLVYEEGCAKCHACGHSEC
ncbi:MAG TPA: adenosylcobalamin-dependent ribonucleoside-diphosphate reductase [Patescibacteria group bacterium]|nr:adenosylcobalamin-dependent ribonucleoside-diphosphate reductase [Patescibacteria group bacterium]